MARGSTETKGEMATVGRNRYEILPKPLKVIILCLVTAGIGLFLLYTFSWSIKGWVLEGTRYYYLLYVCFATCVFLVTPARAKVFFVARVPHPGVHSLLPGLVSVNRGTSREYKRIGPLSYVCISPAGFPQSPV